MAHRLQCGRVSSQRILRLRQVRHPVDRTGIAVRVDDAAACVLMAMDDSTTAALGRYCEGSVLSWLGCLLRRNVLPSWVVREMGMYTDDFGEGLQGCQQYARYRGQYACSVHVTYYAGINAMIVTKRSPVVKVAVFVVGAKGLVVVGKHDSPRASRKRAIHDRIIGLSIRVWYFTSCWTSTADR